MDIYYNNKKNLTNATMNLAVIYRITCITDKPNNFFTTGYHYVGSTVNFFRRFKEHRKMLRGNRHYNRMLQNIFNKYGESNFHFTIEEIVQDESDLLPIEQNYIDYYGFDNLINLAPIVGSGPGVQSKEIFQVSKTNNTIIAKHESIKKACRTLGIKSPKSIREILNLSNRSCYGYRFFTTDNFVY